MRYVLVSLTLLGFIASGLALREHYRTDTSPCSINERWDCGIVNHSPFAVLAGIPVAVIGMAGYVLLAMLAFRRAYRLFLAAALVGLIIFTLPGTRGSSYPRGVVRLLRGLTRGDFFADFVEPWNNCDFAHRECGCTLTAMTLRLRYIEKVVLILP